MESNARDGCRQTAWRRKRKRRLLEVPSCVCRFHDTNCQCIYHKPKATDTCLCQYHSPPEIEFWECEKSFSALNVSAETLPESTEDSLDAEAEPRCDSYVLDTKKQKIERNIRAVSGHVSFDPTDNSDVKDCSEKESDAESELRSDSYVFDTKKQKKIEKNIRAVSGHVSFDLPDNSDVKDCSEKESDAESELRSDSYVFGTKKQKLEGKLTAVSHQNFSSSVDCVFKGHNSKKEHDLEIQSRTNICIIDNKEQNTVWKSKEVYAQPFAGFNTIDSESYSSNSCGDSLNEQSMSPGQTQYLYLEHSPGHDSDLDMERNGDPSSSSSSSSSSGDSSSDGGSDPHSSSSSSGDSSSDGGSDPHNDSSNSEDSSSEESSDSDEDNFSLAPPNMFNLLEFVEGCTRKDAMAVVLSHGMRHNSDYIATINLFTSLNAILGRKFFPCTKRKLWRDLNKKSAGIIQRALCSRCRLYIGQRKRIQRMRRRYVHCHHCGARNEVKRLHYFVTLSLTKQLQNFLNMPGAAEILRYRETRVKINEEGIEDILDGNEYKRLREEGQPLHSNLNFSYTFNTDGAPVGSKTMQPVYIRLNETEPRIRQRMIFLAAIYIGRKEPHMSVLLKWFVKEANDLSRVGLVWKPDGILEVTSTFHPTVCVVDAKARCCILNQYQHNGHHSCPFCTHCGVSIPDGPCKFPAPGTELILVRRHQEIHYVVPEYQLRTEESMREHLREANERDQIVVGMKPGLCPVFNLRGFKLCEGCSPDDLHPIFEGVVKFHFSLLVSHCNFNQEKQIIVSERIKNLKLPSNLSRKDFDLTNTAKFKGSMWRTWLLYLSIPALRNVEGLEERYLRHLQLLSHAVFLLERDSISEENLNLAERYLCRFVQLFQLYFGPENMRYNVHILLHLVESVRRWGNLFAQSTFGYESWNYKLKKKVKSTFAAIDQIVDRHLLASLVETFPYDESITERIREHILSMQTNSKLHQTARRVGNVYLIGAGRRSEPSHEEQRLLEEEGFNCNDFVTYDKVKFKNRMECHVFEGRDSRSDDSLVYTHEDTFCTVQKIVLLNAGEQNECVGMFVDVLDIGNCIGFAHHIVKVNAEIDEHKLITVLNVRCIGIKIAIGDTVFVTPVANHYEID